MLSSGDSGSRNQWALCEIKRAANRKLKIIKLSLQPHTKPTCPRGGLTPPRSRCAA